MSNTCNNPSNTCSNPCNTQVLEAIKGGLQMEVPNEYAGKIDDLIRSCWEMDPEKRPKFSDVSF